MANRSFVFVNQFFLVENLSFDITLYCGLVAPKTDLIYVLMSAAISTSPVIGL